MKNFWVLVAGVIAAGTVWAFPPGYHPFPEDSRPDAYELQTIYAGKMLRIGDEPVFYVYNILTFDQGVSESRTNSIRDSPGSNGTRTKFTRIPKRLNGKNPLDPKPDC
ncbi:MAG: hypothetical protein EOL86_10290 [Deltaproteobacteria bacterium]|nr:hypothetical protein [Deltaproteobacteria bacterium]